MINKFSDLKLDAVIDRKNAKISFHQLDYYTLFRLFETLKKVFGEGEFLYEQLHNTDLSYFKHRLRNNLIGKLNNNGIYTLGQLFDLSEEDLMNCKGIGRRGTLEVFSLIKEIFSDKDKQDKEITLL